MPNNKGVIASAGEEVAISVVGCIKASIDLDWTEVTGDSIAFEAKAHIEAPWRSIEGYPMEDMDGTGVTEASAPGAWVFYVDGIARLRARVVTTSINACTALLNAE